MAAGPDSYSLAGLIWRLAVRSPLRIGSLIALLGMAAFLLAGGLFFKRGVEAAVSRSTGRLGADLMVVPRGVDVPLQRSLVSGVPIRFSLPAGIEGRLAVIPGIGRIAPQYFLASTPASCCETGNLLLVGFDPERDVTVLPWLREMTSPSLADNELLVGGGVMKGRGASLRFYNHTFTVAARLDRSGTGYFDNAAFIPLAGLRSMELSSRQGPRPLKVAWGQPSAVLVRVAPGTEPGHVAEAVQRANPDVKAVAIPELFHHSREKAAALTRFLPPLEVLVLHVVAVIVASAEFFYWRGRRQTLALFRVHGLSRGAILGFFGMEALLLALLGMGCGGLAAFVLLRLFANYCTVTLGIPILLAPAVAGSALPVLTVRFVLATLVPTLLVLALLLVEEPYALLRRGE